MDFDNTVPTLVCFSRTYLPRRPLFPNFALTRLRFVLLCRLLCSITRSVCQTLLVCLLAFLMVTCCICWHPQNHGVTPWWICWRNAITLACFACLLVLVSDTPHNAIHYLTIVWLTFFIFSQFLLFYWQTLIVWKRSTAQNAKALRRPLFMEVCFTSCLCGVWCACVVCLWLH